MQSILQVNNERCYVCGGHANGDPLDKHHVFGGALRKKSEKYGLTVYLHHSKCHIFGKTSVHQNADVSNALKEIAQRKAMQHFGLSVDDFRKEFHQNYIEE